MRVAVADDANPSRRSGVVKPGPSSGLGGAACHPSRRSGVVKPGQDLRNTDSLSNPSRRSGVVKPGLQLHHRHADRHPSRRSGVVKPGRRKGYRCSRYILAEEAAWSNKGASDGNRAGRVMSRRRVSGGYLLVAIKRWISGWTIDLWRFLNFFRNSDGGMPNWASKARENAAG